MQDVACEINNFKCNCHWFLIKLGAKVEFIPYGLKLKPVFFLTLILQFYDKTKKVLKGVITS